MSAQLTLTDAEMEALLRCVRETDFFQRHWPDDEAAALAAANLKLTKGLNRPSRRRRLPPSPPSGRALPR